MLKFLDEFLDMQTVERGASKNTRQAYEADLTDFSKYIKKEILTASADQIKSYLRMLYDKEFSSQTISRRLSALRQFYQFLIVEKVRQDDPTSTIEMPKKKKVLPKILTEKEVLELFNQADTWGGEEGDRMRAMLELLYASGLRVSELISLPLEAFLRKRESLVVMGKGAKERLVPLNDSAIQAVEKYLRVRNLFLPPKTPSKWLFPSRSKEGHLTRQRFFQLIKKLSLEAGIDPAKVSPHVLRHAFATHLLNHGADLLSVQKMLGHADVSTTQIYTHVMEEKLKSTVYKKHPLAKQK